MPKIIVPKNPASDGTHPTQAASSKVNGPDRKGDASDFKIGNDGEVQPIMQPFPIIPMLAKLNSN